MALNEAKIEEAASWLLSARASGEPFGGIPEEFRPATIAEGMRVSEEIAGRLGRRTVAWKAGFSSPAQMTEFGLSSPPWGRFFEGMVYESPAELPARMFTQPLMEAEVAFRLGADLRPRDGGYSADEVLDAVAAAHIAIEGADVRFRDGLGAGLPSIVADSFAAQSFIAGPEIADWRSRDLNTLSVELIVDDEVKGSAFEGDARCRPVEVLVALANDFAARGIALETGQYLTTGAAAVPSLAQPGQRVVARFDSIGDVVAELSV
jgi:2-keto-4-pentenoate hydratase